MPFYLKESDITSQVAGLGSVLIVPCGFCPAASLAVREGKPYIEPFRRFMKTGAYESFIQQLKGRLEQQGIKAAVFNIRVPHRFVACLWTSGSRRELAKRAKEFDAVVVLGCEGAVQTVCDSVASSDCRVIPGMELEGLMNAVPKVSFPFNISLDMQGVIPVEMRPGANSGGTWDGDYR